MAMRVLAMEFGYRIPVMPIGGNTPGSTNNYAFSIQKLWLFLVVFVNIYRRKMCI
jgi:hypothetical protein